MKEPQRWRDFDGGATAEARALLLNSSALGPSRSEADQIWASLAARIEVTLAPPGSLGSPPQSGIPGHVHGPQLGPTAAASGTGALGGKVTLAVVLLATAGGVVGIRATSSRFRHEGGGAPRTGEIKSYVASPASPISPEPQVQPSAVPHAPTVALPENRPHSEKSAHARAVASAPSRMPTAPTNRPAEGTVGRATIPVNELLEEGRRLDQARRALRAHDPDLALQLLGVGAVATTELAQEREALTIEAEASKPALHAEARKRARAFMRAYPNSPYRARINAIVFEGE